MAKNIRQGGGVRPRYHRYIVFKDLFFFKEMFFLLFILPVVMAAYCEESVDSACIEVDDCTCPGTLDTVAIALLVLLGLLLLTICISVACKAAGRRPRF